MAVFILVLFKAAQSLLCDFFFFRFVVSRSQLIFLLENKREINLNGFYRLNTPPWELYYVLDVKWFLCLLWTNVIDFPMLSMKDLWNQFRSYHVSWKALYLARSRISSLFPNLTSQPRKIESEAKVTKFPIYRWLMSTLNQLSPFHNVFFPQKFDFVKKISTKSIASTQ